MSLSPRFRNLLWLCAAFPLAALADADGYSGDDESNASKLNLNVRAGDVSLDWRPFGGNFFAAAGALHNANQFGTVGNPAGSVPASSNVSLGALSPYLGTYLGIGWSGVSSSNKFSWMVDLGVARPETPAVALNILQSDGHSRMTEPTASKSLRISARAGLSFNMRF